MATAPSLFGATPESIYQAQQGALDTQATAYANMDPFQRANYGIYKGANQLGGAIGGMLGGQDPTMARASQMRDLASQSDTSTPEGLQQYARSLASAGFNQEALGASQAAQDMNQKAVNLSTSQATLAKDTLSNDQEAELRTKLQALPQDATEADISSVVSRYGKPESIMQALQKTEDRRVLAQGRIDVANVQAAAAMERLKEAGASQAAIAQAGRDSREFMAGLIASAKADAQGAKPMAAGAQKSEDVDLAAIDNYAAQQRALATPIANLSPNANGVRKLELGPIKNEIYQAQNASGKSTPESNMYANLRSAVDTAVNLQVSAEKGVQTDSDVKRFSAALIAAYGRNDTKATLEALQLFQTALGTAADKTRTRIQSRRKAQKLDAYVFDPSNALGTPENPIKLD